MKNVAVALIAAIGGAAMAVAVLAIAVVGVIEPISIEVGDDD